MNKKISTPLAVIIICAVLVGGIMLWQYLETSEGEEKITEIKPPGEEKEEEKEVHIKIISPNGGEDWIVGETHDIIWESQGVENVNIFLVNKQIQSHYINPMTEKYRDRIEIATNVPISPGEYSWKIPDDIYTGVINLIVIENTSGEIYDRSDGDFSISIKDEPVGNISTWKTYRHEGHGLEFKYPVNWEVIKKYGRLYIGPKNTIYDKSEVRLIIEPDVFFPYPDLIDKGYGYKSFEEGEEVERKEIKLCDEIFYKVEYCCTYITIFDKDNNLKLDVGGIPLLTISYASNQTGGRDIDSSLPQSDFDSERIKILDKIVETIEVDKFGPGDELKEYRSKKAKISFKYPADFALIEDLPIYEDSIYEGTINGTINIEKRNAILRITANPIITGGGCSSLASELLMGAEGLLPEESFIENIVINDEIFSIKYDILPAGTRSGDIYTEYKRVLAWMYPEGVGGCKTFRKGDIIYQITFGGVFEDENEEQESIEALEEVVKSIKFLE